MMMLEAMMIMRRTMKHPAEKPTSMVVQSVFFDSNGGTLNLDIALFLSPCSSSLQSRFITREVICNWQCLKPAIL